MEALFGFLLTFTRVGSAMLLVPMPGIKDLSKTPKIVLVASITVALFPVWPSNQLSQGAGGQFFLAVTAEMAAGLLLGLAMAFLNEAFQLAAQVITLQTGFSFASTVDPTSQADTTIFQVMSQLATGLLFFILGIHLQFIRLFAHSFDLFSSQNTALTSITLSTVAMLSAKIFVNGLKMGLPVVTLLLLIDLGLAVMNRLQAQLQLMLLSFPVKIVLSFIFLSAIMLRWPTLYERAALQTFDILAQLLSRF